MRNPRFYHLCQRIFNQPVAILPGKAEVIVAALADRLGLTHSFAAEPMAGTKLNQ